MNYLIGLALLIALIFTGCATVEYDKLAVVVSSNCAKNKELGISSDEDIRLCEQGLKVDVKNNGLVFYEPKSFLMVVKGINDKGYETISTSIVSLADHSKPYRARISSGLGKAELVAAFSHGILTSTTARAENTETFAGIATALGTVAAVPAGIGLLEAQAALASAQALAAMPDIDPFAIHAKDGDQTVCQEKPITKSWFTTAMEVSNTIDGLPNPSNTERFHNNKTKLASEFAKWAHEDVCDSETLNSEGTDRLPVKLQKFQEAAQKASTKLTALNKRLKTLKTTIGCESNEEDFCISIAASIYEIDGVNKEISKFYSKSSQPKAIVEFYEIEYDVDGTFLGFSKVWSTN